MYFLESFLVPYGVHCRVSYIVRFRPFRGGGVDRHVGYVPIVVYGFCLCVTLWD